MSFVDGHCDTIVKIMEGNESLSSNEKQLDLTRLATYGTPVQFFAIWMEPRYYPIALRQTIKAIDFYHQEIEKNKNQIGHVLTYKDILENKKQGKISGILSIEGGEALEGELSTLRMYYRMGVRALGLTWNHRNALADGVAEEETRGGLTQFGREVICEMNRLGMIIDVSHISEAGFWDVCGLTEKPFIASHSNARAVCDHKRNLSDDQICAIAKKGGVIGINYYPPFIATKEVVDIEDIMVHIRHMISLVGTDYIGLGSDFDGIDSTPNDLTQVMDTRKLLLAIEKEFGRDTAEKIGEKNFLRVLKMILG